MIGIPVRDYQKKTSDICWTYAIYHDDFEKFYIGCSTDPRSRLVSHRNAIRLRRFNIGRYLRGIELKDLKLNIIEGFESVDEAYEAEEVLTRYYGLENLINRYHGGYGGQRITKDKNIDSNANPPQHWMELYNSGVYHSKMKTSIGHFLSRHNKFYPAKILFNFLREDLTIDLSVFKRWLKEQGIEYNETPMYDDKNY